MCALKVSIVKRRDGTLKVIIGLKFNHSLVLSAYIFKTTGVGLRVDVPTTITVTADLGKDDVDIGPARKVFEILGEENSSYELKSEYQDPCRLVAPPVKADAHGYKVPGQRPGNGPLWITDSSPGSRDT